MKTFLKSAVAALCLAALPVTAYAQQDRRILVINNSDYTIWSITATNPDNDSWGTRDLLGDNYIRPGQSIWIWVSDGSGSCIMDMRAQTRSGQTAWIKREYDVCRQAEWKLGN